MDHALDPGEIFMMCLERSRAGTVVRVSSIVLQSRFRVAPSRLQFNETFRPDYDREKRNGRQKQN